MSGPIITDSHSRENAHKVAFMVNEHPNKNVAEIAGMFQMPAIDFNVAMWRAMDMGFFTHDEKGKTTFHELPGKWIFGELVDQLIQAIPYSLHQINRDERDIEEQYLLNWCQGYPVHDVLIALKWLIREGKIASYEIANTTVKPASKKGKKRGKKDKETVDNYTFYTLPENEEHHWGLKDFKDQSRVKVVDKSTNSV